jgi:PIN domain nuclease of toxin-antitoxin system
MLMHVREEPGWQTVERQLHGALISAVNYSEVLKKSIEYGGSAAATAKLIARNKVEVIPFDTEQARMAAELWSATRSLGLSFADRACLSLGITCSATVLTADRRMAEATVPVKIVHVREGH